MHAGLGGKIIREMRGHWSAEYRHRTLPLQCLIHQGRDGGVVAGDREILRAVKHPLEGKLRGVIALDIGTFDLGVGLDAEERLAGLRGDIGLLYR